MAQLTITINARTNNPPNQLGFRQINLVHNELYTFTEEDFTTLTIPPYQDPEGDNASLLKITQLPAIGQLVFNSIVSSVNDEYDFTDIGLGLLTYQADIGTTISYTDANFEFDIADIGSAIFSGLTDGKIIFKVSPYENLPPTQVGNNSVTINYGETLVFTRALLTTLLTPAYSDPEGDPAGDLLVQVVPVTGVLQVNGIDILNNTIISFDDIDAGLFTYVPDNSIIILDAVDFDFQIADTGSNQFVG